MMRSKNDLICYKIEANFQGIWPAFELLMEIVFLSEIA